MFVNQKKDFYNRKTDKYIVAYLDLLGITNRIKSVEQQELQMNKLYNLYTFSTKIWKEIQIEEMKEIQFKIFSDNIIIVKKLSSIREQKIRDIKSLLMCTGHFQELAASDSVGWMLRGGITIGELFIDDTMVWGEALIKAYHLEDNIANYPRVIIDETIIDEIVDCEVLRDYIYKDFDGLYFLNYLCDCHFCGQMLMEGFELMKQEIGYQYNEKIKQKFNWHMNFINKELDRKNEEKDKKYRLDMDNGKKMYR